jgi:uncharacterized protein YndB with AHSA1/START domain
MSYTVTVVVAAEPHSVWARLTEVAGWPDWNPACVSAEAPETFATGQRLRLQMRLPRGRAFWTTPVLIDLDEPRRLVWETRALGLRAPTATTLEPHDKGTLVTLTSESRGPFGFTYRLTFPEKTQAQMWSGALTGLARSFDRTDLTGTVIP